MNLSILPKDLPKPKDDGSCNHLTNKQIPDLSLPNQDGNLLKLSRSDTFRLIIYCYPMTGNPNTTLPKNWDRIPGARGCTPETCSFRDAHDDFITRNAVPVGLSTQSVPDIKEMTARLLIPYDVVSDEHLNFVNKLRLPTFKVEDKVYIKRLTLIVEKSIIKHFFYPVFPPDLHVKEVLQWLDSNR